MAEKTKIQWTGHTWNPWRGCTKVAEECRFCYAEATSKRNPKVLGVWGPRGKRTVAAESYWTSPLKWNRAAEKAGERRRVFVASLADVFEDWDGPMYDVRDQVLYRPHNQYWSPWGDAEPQWWISEAEVTTGGGLLNPQVTSVAMEDVALRLFRLIPKCPWLDFLLLTKRPEGITERIATTVGLDWWKEYCYANTWLGTSAGTQQTANVSIPHLLKCRYISPVLFVSGEPLLEEVNLAVPWEGEPMLPTLQVDWVIAGGESGSDRVCHLDWIRSLRDQCHDAEVPFFCKQLGSNAVHFDDGGTTGNVGAVVYPTTDPKGGDPAEWPEDLRVRQIPRAA